MLALRVALTAEISVLVAKHAGGLAHVERTNGSPRDLRGILLVKHPNIQAVDNQILVTIGFLRGRMFITNIKKLKLGPCSHAPGFSTLRKAQKLQPRILNAAQKLGGVSKRRLKCLAACDSFLMVSH